MVQSTDSNPFASLIPARDAGLEAIKAIDVKLAASAGNVAERRAAALAVLSATTVVAFASEQDLCAKLRPGVDGIVIEQGERRATFLPAVWDTLPDPAAFLRELRRKAGIPPADGWLDLRVWRYTVDSFAA